MQTKRFGLCAALSAAALLLLAGCAGSGSTAAPALTVESSYPLQYAKQFTVDECTGGYELITIADSQYLVVPQGAAVPEDLPQGTTVLQQPIENIYLVSTSAMDPIISLGALDSIALSGTKADGWYLPEAKAAMQAGQIAYAGKYSAPDYETILASGCELAIENTMIYHTPEVKEQLEKFGIPILVERSSYETDPLARMEWVKLYILFVEFLSFKHLLQIIFFQYGQYSLSIWRIIWSRYGKQIIDQTIHFLISQNLSRYNGCCFCQ